MLNLGVEEGLSQQALEVLHSLVTNELIKRDEDTDPQQLGPILTWREWIGSEYYSGPFHRILYPFWRDEIDDFLNMGYSEWVITGSKGGGKTIASEALTSYKIYTLSRYKYPQRLFGLSEITSLLFIYLSVSVSKASQAGFGELRDYLDNIPYFKHEYKRNPDINTMLLWDNRVTVMPGSAAAQSDLSLSTFGILLDETNFYKAGGGGLIGDLSTAQRIYTDTSTRRKSRFVLQGVDYSFTLLVSSATHDQSFTNTRIHEAEKVGERQKVTSTCGWITNPAKYTKERSLVFIGDEKHEPRIMDNVADFFATAPASEEDIGIVSPLLTDKATVLGVYEHLPMRLQERFIKVPTEVVIEFRKDVYGALRDLAGVSTAPSGKLYTSTPNWMRSCKLGKEAGLQHPFTSDILNITIQSPQQMQDFFRPDILFEGPEYTRFKRHPNALRFIHVDSSTHHDLTGVAMAHLAEFVIDEVTSLPMQVVEIDFLLRISNTQPPDQIDLSKVLAFFFYLRNVHKVRFGKITYDHKAQDMPLQQLMKNHIPADRRSLDKSDAPWLDFVSLLNGGRFIQYYNEFFKKEFFLLDWDRVTRTVDHPPTSTKDISDAVVGAVANCLLGTVTGEARTVEQVTNNILTPNLQHADILKGDQHSWLTSDYERKYGKIRR